MSSNAQQSHAGPHHNQQEHNPLLDFIDAIAGAQNIPETPLRHDFVPFPEPSPEPSPLKNFSTIEQCRENIIAGFEAKSANFATSLFAYQGHHGQTLPIEVGGGYLYPCTGGVGAACASRGYLYQNKRLRIDYPQICDECLPEHTRINNNKRRRLDRSSAISRMPPLTVMDAEEKDCAYKLVQVRLKRVREMNARLRLRLTKTKGKPLTIDNVEDATSVLKTVYDFLSVKLKTLLTDTGAAAFGAECRYLVELSFQLLDDAVAAAKLSYKSSFWWQVMNRMRNCSLHEESPNPGFSKLIRSYLFQMMSARLMSWARGVFEGERKATKIQSPTEALPGNVIVWATIGMDVNTFVGFSLFSLKKKYGIIDELAAGYEHEDKYWLLTDMVAKEKNIINNPEYVSKYYDAYYLVFNRGDMTLIAPRYANLFHGILYQIVSFLNMKNMVEEKTDFMVNARAKTKMNLPAWSKKLEQLAEGVHLVNPEKACSGLMTEIVTKVFNSRGSSVLKRYHSMFLARGGKQASRSTLREAVKQQGLGRSAPKTRKTKITTDASTATSTEK
jgi:hypothetical protein